jgi:hypothetical protein
MATNAPSGVTVQKFVSQKAAVQKAGKTNHSRRTNRQAKQPRHDRRNHQRIRDTECSSRWADDIIHWHDVDYLGNRTGSGTLKIACRGTPKHPCGRLVPPQDVVDAARLPDGVLGPPSPPVWLCTDCRTIARQERQQQEDDTLIRGIRLERVGRWHDGAEHVAVPFADLIDEDSSPSRPVLDLMAEERETLRELPLPTEDDEELARAVAVYSETGNLVDFARMSGEEAIAADQRRRYRAEKRVVV